jgi:hypothetical protein
MLYREIIAVCSEIHTKHINTLCGQNVEIFNVVPGGACSYHWALKGLDLHVMLKTNRSYFCDSINWLAFVSDTLCFLWSIN